MKILIIYASCGAGHFKAAEALYNNLKTSSSHAVVLVDALDYTSAFFKKLYSGTYAFLISKCPFFWGIICYLFDIGWLQPLVRKSRRFYNMVNAKQLHQFLRQEQFDYILSTHFLSNEVAAALKQSGDIKSKIISVVTDFDVHRIWLAKGIDFYTVASEVTSDKLKQLRVPGNKILVAGIPTDERFSAPYDIADLKKKLGLTKDVFTVLIATGSFGIGPIEKIIEALKEFQVIVVCGHNQELFEKLKQKKQESLKIFGLVDNMFELMAVSDVMLTKPGGLSISEALVSQLPMIFFNPIPGQEINNIKVLRKYGIGMSNCSIQGMVEALNKLKTSRDDFLTAVRKTQLLARPLAVRDIISLIK